MTYNLKDEGDHWEERFYHHISPLFPYYEEFWQAVVVPSTRRAADGHLDPCIGLNKDFELVLMAHYSAYFHSGTAFELMDASDKSYSMSWTPHSRTVPV